MGRMPEPTVLEGHVSRSDRAHRQRGDDPGGRNGGGEGDPAA